MGGPPGRHPTGESPAGSVLLDIGGDTGAAVIYVEPRHDGSEMEIRRPPGGWDGTHTAVRRRRLPGGSVWAAVFESLTAGVYQVRLGAETLTVDVRGGRVSEVHWRAPQWADASGSESG